MVEKPFIIVQEVDDKENCWSITQEHAFSDIYANHIYINEKPVDNNLGDYKTESQLRDILKQFIARY